MDTPAPTRDYLELKKFVDELAQFFTRNGSNFEEMSEYLATQQELLCDQMQESEINLNAQHEVMLMQQRSQIENAIVEAESDALENQAAECGIDLSDFDNILQPIISRCTKHDIEAGTSWILRKAITPTSSAVMFKYLLRKVLDSAADFDERLHTVYLVNDTLHHCVRENSTVMKKAIEDVIVPMFCATAVNASDEEQLKLQKLLNLWENKNRFFNDSIWEQLKTPSESISAYNAHLLESYKDMVDEISSSNQKQYQFHQSQHQNFMAHALQQIQKIEKHKCSLKQLKQIVQKLPSPSVSAPPSQTLQKSLPDVQSSAIILPDQIPPQSCNQEKSPLSKPLLPSSQDLVNGDVMLQNNQLASENSESNEHQLMQGQEKLTMKTAKPPNVLGARKRKRGRWHTIIKNNLKRNSKLAQQLCSQKSMSASPLETSQGQPSHSK